MTQTFTQAAQELDESAYQGLKRALELGKWPTGERLSSEQKEICMQGIISYETKHLPENERSGFMPQACKSQSRDTIAVSQED